MSMWRVVGEEERTQLYKLIRGAVVTAIKHQHPEIDNQTIDIITDKIYMANKTYYDVHLMQMTEFIQSTK